ncbi:MAG: hypothetical protein ABSA75_08665 [Candidatus Bathyarchaeia archaeon]|jgi:hypothetical protein
MVGSIWVLTKKIFSLSLVLNSLVTLACVAEIIFNYYRDFPYWQPFSPYIVNGSIFFLVIVAAIVNIFPSASIGRALHTGRFLFHHYVYGFFVLISTSIFVVVFTSISLLSLFLMHTSNIVVNAERFFVLAGFTLFLDDLPDVSKRVEFSLNKLKSRAYQGRKVIHGLQLFTGLVSFYAFLAVAIWTTQHPTLIVPDSFVIGTFLVTSLTSFACVKRKAWLKITPVK